MRPCFWTGRTAGLRVRCKAGGRGAEPRAAIREATPAAMHVKRSRRFIASHCALEVVFLGGRVMVTGCARVKSSKVSEGTLISWPWVNA
jgi:hypothetical protein